MLLAAPLVLQALSYHCRVLQALSYHCRVLQALSYHCRVLQARSYHCRVPPARSYHCRVPRALRFHQWLPLHHRHHLEDHKISGRSQWRHTSVVWSGPKNRSRWFSGGIFGFQEPNSVHGKNIPTVVDENGEFTFQSGWMTGFSQNTTAIYAKKMGDTFFIDPWKLPSKNPMARHDKRRKITFKIDSLIHLVGNFQPGKFLSFAQG